VNAFNAEVLCNQTQSVFPSWQAKLDEHADVNLRCANSICVSVVARETS
jgi:hypothetical protein